MKSEIISRLEDLVKQEMSEEVFSRANEIKNEYVLACQKAEHDHHENLLSGDGEGSEPPARDPLDSRFNELIHILDDREKKFKKLRREEVIAKLEAKQAIADKLQTLIAEETNIGRAFSEFKALQQQWNEIGNVPTRSYKSLQAAYHRHVHNFYYNMKLSKDLRDLDLKRNLEFRLQLLTKIESLLAMDAVRGMERMLGLYRMEWSELGPAPAERADELRTRYRDLISRVLQKIRDHYQDRQKFEQDNLEAKKQLLDKMAAVTAETPSTPKQWQQASDSVAALFGEWKQTGFVPRQENNAVWSEFRKHLSAFHARKRAFFAGLKKEHREHRETKLEIIRKAAELAGAEHPEWDPPTRALIALQREWKDAGPLDAWEERKLWKKFRDACDRFFEAKRLHFEEQDKALEGNLVLKEELLNRMDAFQGTGNTEQDLQTLKAFAAEWKSIPHVPLRDKQRIHDRYKKVLDSKYDALKLDAAQVHLIKFRNNVEMLAHAQDASHLLLKERQMLQDRLRKLQATISQYENNLGFFSNAKSMGGLLSEVEANLNKAKEEMDLLRKKLKVFSDYR